MGEALNTLKAHDPSVVKKNSSLADNPDGFDKERTFCRLHGRDFLKLSPAGLKNPPGNQITGAFIHFIPLPLAVVLWAFRFCGYIGCFPYASVVHTGFSL